MTNEPRAEIVTATARLRDALEQVANALATPHLDALLAGERAIERALAAMPAIAAVDVSERASLGHELEHARRTLMRCRRLGAALTDVVRISFEAQGRGPSYGPRGTLPMFDGTSVRTRV